LDVSILAPVEDLRFTIDRSQMRGLRIYTVGGAAAFVVFAGGWALSGRAGMLGTLALMAAIVAVIGGYAWAVYAAAFTECTPTGLRTRGFSGTRQSAWPGIADIRVRPYGQTASVMVTTASGARFRLGAPVDGGVMKDPEFMNRTLQVIAYCGRRPPRRGRSARRRLVNAPRFSGGRGRAGSLLPNTEALPSTDEEVSIMINFPSL
jgi:hypothetical protein